MSAATWVSAGVAACLSVYAVVLVALVLVGRREHVRAVAGFIPDCLVLVRRLLADPRVPARRKWLLSGLLVYLALPIDLVPDFLPVVGQLDDVIVAVLVLRAVLASGGPQLLRDHWPGPKSSLDLVIAATFGRVAGSTT